MIEENADRHWLLSNAWIDGNLHNLLGGMSQDHWEYSLAVHTIKRFTKPIKTILEIGVCSGYSMMGWLWAIADSDVRAVGLDAAPNVSAPLPANVTLITGDSHSRAMVNRIHEMFPRGVDFLFIDGDHSLQGCRDDYNYYAPLVAPGGVLGFHDIKIGDVRATWREVVKRYPTVQLQNKAKDGSAMGIGLAFRLPHSKAFEPIELDEE